MEHDISDENLNISDVIEVIKTTDPGFVESNGHMDQDKMEINRKHMAQPYVEIVEQPASKSLRFRYECEGRSAGSIPGVNSTPENKTFPTIRIVGYKGRAVVVVSCVTKDLPYRPHPHNLVGKEACKQGICTLEITSDNMTVTFANLGIQCVKKKDIEEALKIREEIRVDPFRTGFEHRKQPTSIDLNAVRLCFQVFLEGTRKGKFTHPLQPVVSDPIFDKKAMSDLSINHLSHNRAPSCGGMKMILLCEKVAKEDIQVRFFEEKNGHVIWEGYGDFAPTDVHKQTAIVFKTPSFRLLQIEEPVQIYIQLKRPSDGVTSEPHPFEMSPLDTGSSESLKRKRQKFDNSPNAILLRGLQAEAQKSAAEAAYQNAQYYNIIKPEPVEAGPLPFGRYTTNLGSYSLQSQPQTQSQPQLQSTPQQQLPLQSQPLSNLQTLRPQVSPGRATSPMEYGSYNLKYFNVTFVLFIILNLTPLILDLSYRPQVSPCRTASPMEYNSYNPLLAQTHLSPSYQPSSSNMTQQPSVGISVPEQYSFLQESNLSNTDQMILSKVTSKHLNTGLEPIYNNGNLDKIDLATDLGINQQYFDLTLNTAGLGEFETFDTELSTNLLSGLSISEDLKEEGNDNVKLETDNVGENNMTDSYTNITKNTIQELCDLNDIYRHNKNDDT
ncbi:PREDICTED: embryonic polarity protein dorsal-like isoform X3 [Polistes dominula]|uniref:Embryonic polarity protein dorsal-like isoform X3 n=1 Tax=Polistes dominula TaxID=743375 RepID=A0ABM1HXY7_POLDO|nr:PREDICTED: embryonic polarity protein dorsal-like isoform X3 [Polistes dominula]